MVCLWLKVVVLALTAPTTQALTITDPQYMGCWDYDMLYLGIRAELSMPATIDACLSECRAQRFTYAGLQNGQDCWCGKDFRSRPSSGCSHGIACQGNSSTICGSKQQVSVYRACPFNMHGRHCMKKCAKKCGKKGCLLDGACEAYCPPGFTGENCEDPCAEGTYGAECSNCPESCLNRKCDPVLGFCIEGCKSGKGPWCMDQCPDPVFISSEEFQMLSCPFCGHCNNSQCVGGAPYCVYKCPVDWKGAICMECQPGYWGVLCEHRCPEECVGSCDMTGNCNECGENLYGVTCDHECGHCENGTCNKDDGHCSPCVPGYYGKICLEECPNGCACDQLSGECINIPGDSGIKQESIEDSTELSENLIIDSRLYSSRLDGDDFTSSTESIEIKETEFTTNITTYDPKISQIKELFEVMTLPTAEENIETRESHETLDEVISEATAEMNETEFTADMNLTEVKGTKLITTTESRILNEGTETPSHNRYVGQMQLSDQNTSSKCSNCARDLCDYRGFCVDGCKISHYGEFCELRCPDHCFRGTCYRVNGSCFDGCITGFYDPYCRSSCIECFNGECDANTGVCQKGCEPGWRGDSCKIPCPHGTFGVRCLDSCHCANNAECNHISGLCPRGCDANYEGDTCSKSVKNSPKPIARAVKFRQTSQQNNSTRVLQPPNHDNKESVPASSEDTTGPVVAALSTLSGLAVVAIVIAGVTLILLKRKRMSMSEKKLVAQSSLVNSMHDHVYKSFSNKDMNMRDYESDVDSEMEVYAIPYNPTDRENSPYTANSSIRDEAFFVKPQM